MTRFTLQRNGITPNMPFFAVSSDKTDYVPKMLMMSLQIDLSRLSLISVPLCPNSFSSIKASLVRSTSFDGWPCLRNSCWAAKSPL